MRRLRAGDVDAQRGALVGEGLSGAGEREGWSPPPHDSGDHPHATFIDPRSDTTRFAEHVEMTLFHFSCGSQETVGAAVVFWI